MPTAERNCNVRSASPSALQRRVDGAAKHGSSRLNTRLLPPLPHATKGEGAAHVDCGATTRGNSHRRAQGQRGIAAGRLHRTNINFQGGRDGHPSGPLASMAMLPPLTRSPRAASLWFACMCVACVTVCDVTTPRISADACRRAPKRGEGGGGRGRPSSPDAPVPPRPTASTRRRRHIQPVAAASGLVSREAHAAPCASRRSMQKDQSGGPDRGPNHGCL